MNSHPRIVTHQRTAKRYATLLWCALLGAGISPSAAQTGAWKPTRPVEIIVGVSPGGGLDRTARTLQKIMHDNRYMNSRELTNYFDAQYAEFKNIPGDLGLSRQALLPPKTPPQRVYHQRRATKIKSQGASE